MGVHHDQLTGGAHTITVVLPEILTYAAFAVACMLAVMAEGRLIRRMARDPARGDGGALRGMRRVGRVGAVTTGGDR